MANGRITSWRADRGFGFIRPDEGGDDIFFHVSDLQGLRADQITLGIAVTYREEEGARGPRARGVRPVATPRGSGQTLGSYRFLNPYNFVRFLALPGAPAINETLTGMGAAFRAAGLTPAASRESSTQARQLLGRCPPPPHDRYLGLTGSMSCTLTAVTPLFVSDSHAVKEGQDKHRTYRFLQVGENQPVIPGSSLRGVFRSIFEAVTNSCLPLLPNVRLSRHLPPADALRLVPARVEGKNGDMNLRLLTGATRLNVSGRPDGPQYAAWILRYSPLQRSRNLRGSTPYGRRSPVELHGLKHGSRCWAILKKMQHPNRNFEFWNVEQVASDREELRSPEQDEIVREGYLCLTNQNIENKHDERFFFYEGGLERAPTVPLDYLACDDYSALIRDYQQRHRNRVEKVRNDGGDPEQTAGDRTAFSRFIVQEGEEQVKEGDLVYAMLKDGNEVDFIVPVSVPRIAYQHSVSDLLPGHLTRCQEYNELCPACRVFGWVYQARKGERVDPKKGVAYAGRVRFSHAQAQPESFQFDTTPRTLAILSTPKPTTTAFYLARAGGVPGQVDYNVPDAQLRGRKFYRHQGRGFSWNEAAPPPKENNEDNKSDQNRTLKNPVQDDARFTFQVDFENLAPVELGALLWSLELEEGMYHRLGFAKPLGLGSVKVTIDSLRLLDRRARYESLEEGWQEVQDARSQWIQDFKDAMGEVYGGSFETLPNVRDLKALLSEPSLPHVHYPRSERTPGENGENFRWFVGNKRRRPDQGGPFYLPLAEDDTIGLPLLNERGHETN